MSLVTATGLAIPHRLATTDLQLQEGSITCLVGPNGSGKTSLLHALAGIGRPLGTVRIGSVDPMTVPPAARPRLLAYLPASRELQWPLTARAVVKLSGADEQDVADAMERLELAPFADRRSDRLSTGERSRVLIARAMATRPRLLLLDEPTANLDPLWQIRLMNILREEIEGTSRAAVVAMHDLDAAGRHADRLIVMHRGRIAADGPPDQVLSSATIPQVFGIEPGLDGWRPVVTA